MRDYDDDYEDTEAYPLQDDTVIRPEMQLESLGALDWLLALVLGGISGGLMFL